MGGPSLGGLGVRSRRRGSPRRRFEGPELALALVVVVVVVVVVSKASSKGETLADQEHFKIERRGLRALKHAGGSAQQLA